MPGLGDEGILFIVMVFVAVFLVAQSFMLPAFGENRQARKRLRKRLKEMSRDVGESRVASLVREQYFREMSPLDRWISTRPGMERLSRAIEQAGWKTPPSRLVLASATVGATLGGLVWVASHHWIAALFGAAAGVGAPFMRLNTVRRKRVAAFEEQLPDALNVMSRGLRAGHPFSETLRLVADDMPDPMGREFGLVFAEVNYGGDLRTALTGLLHRLPSVTVMALVSAVLIQKETGGNLSELLDKLAAVVRGRFRFQRKVRTLAADARYGAWILTLLPFFMAGVLSLINPEYLPKLTGDPLGRKLIVVAFVLLIVGTLWMRKIVRIDV